MKEIFTPGRSALRSGLVSLSFFLAMLAGDVLGISHDLPPYPWVFLLSCRVLCWSGMVGLAACLVLGYFRESITLEGDEVLFTHILGKRLLALSKVLRARWRLRSPSLKLFYPGGKEMVRFNQFPAGDRERLIRYFREHVRPEVQEGWTDDLERYAAEVAVKASPAEFNKFFRSLRWTLLVGPLVGLGAGLFLCLYAGHIGVDAVPTWTGWLLLDWAVTGTLVSAGLLASLRVVAWMTGLES